MSPEHLFVLCPPFSGSTVLWRLLCTGAGASALADEGQFLAPVRPIMRRAPWDPQARMPWARIRAVWEAAWDPAKPVRLEKSPPNLLRAFEIERAFEPASFVAMVRDPYATCEGLLRRRDQPPMAPGAPSTRARALAHAARLWLGFAATQKRNIDGLRRVLSLTYEDLCADARGCAERLAGFVPALGTLDPDAVALADRNAAQVARLSPLDIVRIDRVLGQRSDLVDAFGYRLREARA